MNTRGGHPREDFPHAENKEEKAVIRPFSPVAPPLLAHFRIGSDILRADNQITLARHLQLMGARIVNSIESMMSTTNKVGGGDE
jgi:hypothetical protein